CAISSLVEYARASASRVVAMAASGGDCNRAVVPSPDHDRPSRLRLHRRLARPGRFQEERTMPIVRISSPASGGRSLTGKIVGSLFFLPFLALGVWFAALMAWGFYRGARTYTWDQAECLILESSVDEHPEAAEANEAYRFKVLYTYMVRGARYTSD